MKKTILMCDKCLNESDKELWSLHVRRPSPSAETTKSYDLCVTCKDKINDWVYTK